MARIDTTISNFIFAFNFLKFINLTVCDRDMRNQWSRREFDIIFQSVEFLTSYPSIAA